MPNDVDDWDLLSQKEDNEAAFAELFRRNKDYVYRLARGFLGQDTLAEDVTQEVFVRIYRMRKRWFRKAAFRTWLYRMTLNTSRELLRNQRRSHRLVEAIPSTIQFTTDDGPDTDEVDLGQVLNVLPQKQREVVLLRFYERMSVAETAKALGCREGTVKSHLHKAIRTMRKNLSTRDGTGT